MDVSSITGNFDDFPPDRACNFLLRLLCVTYPWRTYVSLVVKFCATIRGFIPLIPLDHSEIKSNWDFILIIVAFSIKAFLVLHGLLEGSNSEMGWGRRNMYLINF